MKRPSFYHLEEYVAKAKEVKREKNTATNFRQLFLERVLIFIRMANCNFQFSICGVKDFMKYVHTNSILIV